MSFLAVVTADGGVPLFTRSSGQVKTKLPFATVGTVNGVHMYSRLNEFELKRVATVEEKIIYREYHDRIKLILITGHDACNDCHITTLLDNIFAAMALIVGIDLLLKQGEVTRLQKALVSSYPLIDSLLSQLDQNHGTVGDLTLMTDCLLVDDTQSLQTCMGQFLDVADSLYGCLLIKGKVVTASKEWWTLTNQEKVLMCSYINSLPKALSHEVIIYLPTSSPQNSTRLITLHLLPDVEVCVLCSAEPPLSVLEEEAPKKWKECFDILKVVSNIYPRNFPQNVKLDENILGVMLINTDVNQSVCSVQPSYEESGLKVKDSDTADMNKKQEALRSLYKLVVGTFFKNESEIDNKLKGSSICPTFDYGEVEWLDCTPHEYYIYTDRKKAYVINQEPFKTYIVYNDEIPHYAIRTVSYQTLELLTESCFPESS